MLEEVCETEIPIERRKIVTDKTVSTAIKNNDPFFMKPNP